MKFVYTGKRVIHSVFTENKLNEVRKVLATNDDMVILQTVEQILGRAF